MSTRPLPDGLVLAFYGDDFTGSTDAMEALTANGVPAILYLAPPTSEELAATPGYRALGVAGISRSQSPAWMDTHLPPVFTALKALGAPLVHYKVCSTFDSAPHTGSIGRAIEIGARVFGTRPAPLIVGAPVLKRYVVFGNLFASVGEETFRIDRHPTMRRHPVTPMAEADLRRHLARQTNMRIALADVLALRRPDVDAHTANLAENGAEILLFDTIDDETLATAGRLIWEGARAPRFVAGSSGVEYALTAHWRAAGLLGPPPAATPSPAVDQVIVVSGSCSPVTGGQIAYAIAKGHAGIRVDARAFLDEGPGATEERRGVDAALAALEAGRSVTLYTAEGPGDPSIADFEAAAKGLAASVASERVGRGLGRILRAVLLRTGLRRAVVAGGDTSGWCCRELGLRALAMRTPIAPGSPLCAAVAIEDSLAGLEIALKGGQVGGPDYFEAVREGRASPQEPKTAGRRTA